MVCVYVCGVGVWGWGGGVLGKGTQDQPNVGYGTLVKDTIYWVCGLRRPALGK